MRNADELFAAFKAGAIRSQDMTIEERDAVQRRALSEAIPMPLFDFKCETCGRVKEFLLTNADVPVPCPEDIEHGAMTRLPSAPGSVRVEGFSSINGYSSARSITTDHGNGVKSNVKGNFEAFSDGLHK